ncbi:MAG TPA: aminoglycoside phosphotransferase family protein [Actinomycetota bacterium]|nr:aminoglycoside phosphotransferase family protein [Actinomycetota bacterium]
MSSLRLPENLSFTLRRLGDEGRQWTDQLPEQVGDLERRWGLTTGPAFEPGGYCAYVVPASCEDGSRAVLKITLPKESARRQSDALRLWDGRGAVRVLREEAWVLLLERCEPGAPLTDSHLTEDQALAATGVLRRIWRPAPDTPRWPRLTDRAALWPDELRSLNEAHMTPLSANLIEDLAGFAATIAEATGHDTLLHGEIGPQNVLSAQREPWLAIDPEPVVGDRAADAAYLACYVPDEAESCPEADVFQRRIRLLGTNLDLDRSHLTWWALLTAVQELLGGFNAGTTWTRVKMERAGVLASLVT